MFSGFGDINKSFGNLTADLNLGSIADINISSKLTQFANQLSLDNLQNDENVGDDMVKDTVSLTEPEATKQAKAAGSQNLIDSNYTLTNDTVSSEVLNYTNKHEVGNQSFEVETLQETIRIHRDLVSAQQQSLDELTRNNNELQLMAIEKNELVASLFELRNVKDNLESKVSDIQLKLDQTIETLSRTTTTNEELQNQLTQYGETIKRLTYERNEMEDTVNELQQQKDSLDLDVRQLNERLATLDIQHRDNLSKIENEYKTELSKYEETVSQLRKDKEMWTSRIDELLNEVKSRSEGDKESSNFPEAQTFLSDRIKQLESEISLLNDELKKSNATIMDLRSKLESTSDSIAEVASLEDSNSKLTAEKSKLKEKLDKSVAALKLLKETTAQLREDMKVMEQTHDNEKNDLVGNIKLLEERLGCNTSVMTENLNNLQILSDNQAKELSDLAESNKRLMEQIAQISEENQGLQNLANVHRDDLSKGSFESKRLMTELDSYKARVLELEQLLASTTSASDEKDVVVNDMKSKIASLTDKLKDVVQKFADLKIKNQFLEESEAKVTDVTKQLQLKVI